MTALDAASGKIGAIVTFTGHCRDEAGRLAALELEHYPGMAEAELARICTLAAARWPLLGISVVHRYGILPVGARIVLVMVAAPHRKAAFAGAEFIMDFLKTDAPFWKKEHPVTGTASEWVSAKEDDSQARIRWGQTSPAGP